MMEIINLKGNPNCMIGSKVTRILLDGGIFPVGGVASGWVCVQPAEQARFIRANINFKLMTPRGS